MNQTLRDRIAGIAARASLIGGGVLVLAIEAAPRISGW